MADNLRSREIRWMLLAGLREKRRIGAAQSGGWLSELMILEVMNVQGYELTLDEIKDELEYLIDKKTAEKQKVGVRVNKYRITAIGVDVIDGQIKIAGIGVSAGK